MRIFSQIFFRWTQCHHKGLLRKIQEGQRQGNVIWKAEIGGMWPQAKECGQVLEAGRGKEMSSPLEPSEGDTLILVSEDLVQTSDCPNHKIINLCCLCHKVHDNLLQWPLETDTLGLSFLPIVQTSEWSKPNRKPNGREARETTCRRRTRKDLGTNDATHQSLCRTMESGAQAHIWNPFLWIPF
jgi:hypothetical protein